MTELVSDSYHCRRRSLLVRTVAVAFDSLASSPLLQRGWWQLRCSSSNWTEGLFRQWEACEIREQHNPHHLHPQYNHDVCFSNKKRSTNLQITSSSQRKRSIETFQYYKLQQQIQPFLKTYQCDQAFANTVQGASYVYISLR